MGRAEEGTQEETWRKKKRTIRREDEQLSITLNSRCGCESLSLPCLPILDSTSYHEVRKQLQ